MRKKFRVIGVLLLIFSLSLQTVVFAGSNRGMQLKSAGTEENGYRVASKEHLGKETGTVYLSDGTKSKTVVYCADAETKLKENHSYVAMNLEDSGVGIENAARLRSILKKSYPFLGVKEVKEAFKLESLNVKEAITATQLAVWELTNGIRYDSNSINMSANKRVNALRDAYLNLTGSSAVGSIAGVEVKTTQTNGKLDIAYRAMEENQDGSKVELNCKLQPNMESTNTGRDEAGYQHTIVNNPSGIIGITVDGVQQVKSDVYFYQAVGGAKDSQSLVGIKEGAVAVQNTIEVDTERMNAGIQIEKIDSKTNKAIANVEFLLSQTKTFDEFSTKITTNQDGIAEIQGLAAGKWYVRESKNPGNYMPLEEDIVLTVGSGIEKLQVKNTPYAGIKILKINEAGAPLGAAKFNIYEGNTVEGEPIHKDLVTNDDGIIFQGGLVSGIYTVLETEAPVNYEKDATPITVELRLGETRELKFINKYHSSSEGPTLNIFKYDAQTKEQLSGAAFKIYDDEARLHEVGSIESLKDKPAVISNLKAGTYYIEEVAAPEGYLKDAAVQKVVLKNNQTTVAKFYNTQGIPTAGNYGELLLYGVMMSGLCMLGWAGLYTHKKRSR